MRFSDKFIKNYVTAGGGTVKLTPEVMEFIANVEPKIRVAISQSPYSEHAPHHYTDDDEFFQEVARSWFKHPYYPLANSMILVTIRIVSPSVARKESGSVNPYAQGSGRYFIISIVASPFSLTNLRTDLIHEFTHVFDPKTNPDLQKKFYTPLHEDIEKYFLSPGEFDARMNELSITIQDSIRRTFMNMKEDQKLTFIKNLKNSIANGDFLALFNALDNYSNPVAYRALALYEENEKYRIAWRQKIYKLLDMIEDEVKNQTPAQESNP